MFDVLIEAARVSDLVASGTLIRPEVLSHPQQPDLGGVKRTAGDFNQEQLEARVNRSELRGDVVETWLARANDEPTVVFAVSIAHSKALVADFEAAGVPCGRVDGKMNERERSAAIAAIRDGRSRVIVNVGILTEGWDFPELAVCQLARPTESLSLLLQMWGRVMRTAPGKSRALVIDHAGNVLRHGLLPWHDVPWSLDHSRERKKRGVPSLKNCPKCYYVVASQVRTCICGYVWPVHAAPLAQTSGELVAVNHLDVLALARQAIGKAAMYAEKQPSAFTKKLLGRIETGKVPENFLRLVVRCRGSVGKAAFTYNKIYGKWP